MNKKRKTNEDLRKKAKNITNISTDASYNEEYGYDFIPMLNQWLNIDEQKQMTKRLEDIKKD